MVRGTLPWRLSSRAAATVYVYTLLLTLVTGVRSQGPDCRYKYTRQPRPDPICNPYISGTLRVECTSQVPVTATDVSIGWLLSCNPLSDDANITIVEEVSNMTSYLEITSRLTIGNLSDDYAGKYGCTIMDSRDEEFIPSDLLELKTRFTLEVENARDSPCASSVVFSRAQPKCAELTENDTIPMSLSCADPAIQSTAFNDIIMTSSSSVIQTTATPLPTHPPSSAVPSSFFTMSPSLLNLPIVTEPSSDPTKDPTTSSPSSPNAIWLYVVVALAAIFLLVIIVLAIVFVGMCLRRQQSVTIDEQTLKQPGHSKQFTGMLDNGAYQSGRESYPTTDLVGNSPAHLTDMSNYNTLGAGEYETVHFPGENYQRLQRPTLTPGMLPRFVSSPENAGLSPTSTLTSVRTHSTTLPDRVNTNGTSFPPPLPSTGRRGNVPRPINNLKDFSYINGTAGSFDERSPLERDRIDSASLLLPGDRNGSKSSPDSASPGGHECLYAHHDQGNMPVAPSGGGLHPLENIPETGNVFPEPENPNAFPTYETIPTADHNRRNTASPPYEKPINSEHSSARIHAATKAPHHSNTLPASNEPRRWMNEQHSGRMSLSPRHNPHTSPSPLYNTLEAPQSYEMKESVEGATGISDTRAESVPTPAFPVFETADFTAESESSTVDTFTPGFPMLDTADYTTDYTGSSEFSSGGGIVPKPKVLSRGHSRERATNDFTGDSDYPHSDYTGGSSSTTHSNRDCTGNTMSDGTLTGIFDFSGAAPGEINNDHTRKATNGKCSTIAGYPPKLPASTSMDVRTEATSPTGGVSQTLSAPRNHYKRLDPATMEARLKYTRLNVGKHTPV